MSDWSDNPFAVIPDRPPSIDEKGYRRYVIPAEVQGYYRKWRTAVYTFLIFIFLVLPWTKFRGEQTVLLDFPQRRFLFFGHSFYAHDAPMVFFILATFVFLILLVTAWWGRVWCGWACPQTVFIDSLFRRIETLIEGSAMKRRRLAEAPWTWSRIGRLALKWFLFFLVSSHIAHSFFAYFVGARQLVWVTLQPPTHHMGLFIAVQIITLILLADFGWFREQFCLIVCPYGRFQSALIDRNSLTVTYDYQRGEPRKVRGSREHGDCVNCLRCVNVCPTGIDIRDGLQMECIACTACIDACDDVMTKIKKPTGLIRYTSQSELQGLQRRTWSLRIMLYVAVLALLLSGGLAALLSRPAFTIKVVRAVEAPYQQILPGVYMNHFRFHLYNQSNEPLEIQSIESLDANTAIISPQVKQILKPGAKKWLHVFLRFPGEVAPTGKGRARWQIRYGNKTQQIYKGEVTLLAPASTK